MIAIPKEINSRFRFVVIAAKRAVQLQRGAKPKYPTESTKWTRIAIREVSNNLIAFVDPKSEEEPVTKGRSRAKKSKEKD